MEKINKPSFDPTSFETKWPRTTLTSSRALRARLGRARIRGKQVYNPTLYESKWQEVWERLGVYQPDMKKAGKPFYNLMMYPYPSAEGLHVGNMYAFTGADIYGRFKRMQKYDVFEPIGLDGFGIHSENYALKIGKHPGQQAKISEKNFYRQLRASGNGFAWKNTLETYDPDYYRWTQWIFVQMFKHGLAYRKKSALNFCPSCKTVLADEQVIDGACERCKSLVSKKEMEQWFFRITAYAEKLLQNTYKPSFNWSEKVKIGQRNWIGRSEGVNFKHKVKDLGIEFEVYDSIPQTHRAQTFIVIAPEHPLVKKLVMGTKYEKEVLDFVEKVKQKKSSKKFDMEKERDGVFTGRYSENYLGTGVDLPIWVASYAIMDYGTGIVGCSAHDERDFGFAKKYGIKLKPVLFPKDKKLAEKVRNLEIFYLEPDGILEEPAEFKGQRWDEARKTIIDYIEANKLGRRTVNYKLRDWCISRQRYWGAPIPMIYCNNCAEKGIGWLSLHKDQSQVLSIKYQVSSNDKNKKNKNILNTKYLIPNTDIMPGWFPVPEKDLPVLLPALDDWKPEGTGKGPLAKLTSFVKTKCPHCGGEADRETDVCDTFLDSSWYFLRYPSINSKKDSPCKDCPSSVPWDPDITKRWLPVSIYIGGAEHTVLHLLYSRFVWMCFYDWGYFDFSAKGRPASGWDEPYRRFYAHGLIIAEGAKMSKSKGNIIVPDEYIRKYGADTLRAYLMFLGPFDMGGDFRDTGVAGMYRFLGRVWRLAQNVILNEVKNPNPSTSPRFHRGSAQDDALLRVMHRAIKEVTEDLENLRYNTAIAHIMEYVNELQNSTQLLITNYQLLKTLLLLLAPFAPHTTEELWQKISIKYQVSSIKYDKNKKNKNILNTKYLIPNTDFRSIHLHPWPSYDQKYLIEDEVTIIVQVNGKLRETIKMQNAKCKIQNEVEKESKKREKVKKHLEGKAVHKVIFVPGRLINFVV